MILTIRPEPGSATTVAAGRALGLMIESCPMSVVRPCHWSLPTGAIDGLLLGSANALRYGGPLLKTLVDKPVYAVGTSTAATTTGTTAAMATATATSTATEPGVQAAIDARPARHAAYSAAAAVAAFAATCSHEPYDHALTIHSVDTSSIAQRSARPRM